MKVFIATKNQKKFIELERILKPLGFEVLSEKNFDTPMPEIEETGTDFKENALLKAKAGLKFTGLISVADDSGICVDYLGGAPGIFSARFSGGNDKDNNDNWGTAKRTWDGEVAFCNFKSKEKYWKHMETELLKDIFRTFYPLITSLIL